jgi:predicted Zn-dependent protease
MSMPSDPALYNGKLSDGRTAASFDVKVRLGEAGLEVLRIGERQPALVWSYADLVSNLPLRSDARDIVLSAKPSSIQTLFVADPAFSSALYARARHLSAARQRIRSLGPGAAAVALVLAVALTVRLLDLHPAQTIARMLPQQTREAMGRSVVAQVGGQMRQCETAGGRAALDRLTQRLKTAATEQPLPVRVVVIDWGLVNAFAAPGGQIILTRGLLQRANSADEVAGVLSHELGHALELHPEAGLVRAMGLAAAAQLVFAGTTGTATNIGLLLTQLRYTRVAEREADAHAIRILKNAQISAKGFGDFFERLEPKIASPPDKASEAKGSDDGKKSLGSRIFTSELLRTHPLTTERLELVRSQAAYPATPALSDADWRALRDVCGPPAPPPPSPGTKSGPTIGKTPPLPAPVPAPPPAPSPTQTQAGSAPDTSDADRAIADATKALQTNPYDIAQLQLRARAYTRKGQHADALADYVKATELRPADANLQVARGGTHFALRQYELALVAYDEAIRLDASHLAARNGRGNTYRALKRYPEAVEEFDTLIRMRPSFVFAYYNRGLANIDMGRTEAAIADFTSALAIDSSYAGAYTQRGLVHEKAGARDNAIADFRAAVAAPAGKYESSPWAQRMARDRLKALGVNP